MYTENDLLSQSSLLPNSIIDDMQNRALNLASSNLILSVFFEALYAMENCEFIVTIV
jgi:hypothetical protein